MHAALRDHFAIEVRELFEQPDVLHQDRATRTGGHRVLVIDYRRTGSGGEFLAAHQSYSLRLVQTESGRGI
jgi:hypothetical protein